MSDSRVVLTVGLAKLLHKLGTDDDFRAEFQRDPQGVLKRHGVELTLGDLKAAHLPSKEDLVKSFPEYLDATLKDPAAGMSFSFGYKHHHHD